MRFRRFWNKEPPVIHKTFLPKRFIYNTCTDDFGLRSPPVIHKTFLPKSVYFLYEFRSRGLLYLVESYIVSMAL